LQQGEQKSISEGSVDLADSEGTTRVTMISLMLRPILATMGGEQKSISQVSVVLSVAENEGRATNETARELLYEHHFGRPHQGETEKLVVCSWINKALLFFV
jgi:hypothetical protein